MMQDNTQANHPTGLRQTLEHALALLAMGWFIIPLCWPAFDEDVGLLECGCSRCKNSKDVGKRPLVGKGYQNLRADEAQIRKWWAQWPHANIGILLEPSCLLIIDTDSAQAIEEAEELGLPKTMCVKTGKGRHYYFKRNGSHPVGRTTQRGNSQSIDILSKGYIVAPGSQHKRGTDYEIIVDEEPAPPPTWACDMLLKKELRKQPKPDKYEADEFISKLPPSDLLALLESALYAIPSDEREIWMRVGMALHDWEHKEEKVGQGWELWDRWSKECSEKYHEDDQEATWKSFKIGGGITIATVFGLAKEYDWQHPGSEVSHQPANSTATVEKKKEPPQAKVLIELCKHVYFFCTPDEEQYATFDHNGNQVTWPLYSQGFKRWLIKSFFRKKGIPPATTCLNGALSVLETRAFDNKDRQEVFIRIGHHGESLYVDLCNEAHEVVEISPDGWEIKRDIPVSFKRSKGMWPLVKPQKGGSINEIFQHLNMPSCERQRKLIVGWLLMSFHPKGPYPLLVLGGEQGSAKSTTARMLRSLVDPSKVSLNSKPKEERDLFIASNNSWVLVFDNLSGLSGELSDAFCRLSTGGGMRTRALFTDAEEVLFDASRPIVITGIGSIITRQDLTDRALLINLPPIEEDARQDELTLRKAWEKARPKVLGAIFTTLSAALKRFDQVKLPQKPRMADFARWVTAAEEALGWEEGSFLEAYNTNRNEALAINIESDPVALGLINFMDEVTEDTWEGTAKELLDSLTDKADERTQKLKSWPKAPNSLSNKLGRAAPFLRKIGVDINFGSAGRGTERRRLITITRSQ